MAAIGKRAETGGALGGVGKHEMDMRTGHLHDAMVPAVSAAAEQRRLGFGVNSKRSGP